MHNLSQLGTRATALFAALAISAFTISATVSPVDFATSPAATQGIIA